MAKAKNADSGCFKGILRLLLCQGSLQTHPSDQIPEPKKNPEFYESKPEVKKTEASSGAPPPGIVARLMGLDSLPEAKWIPKGKAPPPESVTRSRSVNFMEYLLEFDVVQGQEQEQEQAHHQRHQHRRVRTSLSFREVPTILNQQNQDLFVLYLDEEDEKKMGLKERKGKASVNLGDLKQNLKEKEEKNKNKKKENQVSRKKVSKFIDEPRRVSVNRSEKTKNCKGAKDFGAVLPAGNKKYGNKESEAVALKKKKKTKKSPVKPMHQNEVSAKGKISKKGKNHLVIDQGKPLEFTSENSSPVSVLDVNEFSISDDTPLSDELRYMDMNSFNKSSSANTLSYDDLDQLTVIKNRDQGSIDSQNLEYCSELVANLHKYTEEAIMQSNWVPEKLLKFEDLEELSKEFGHHILEILLEQLIEEELTGFNLEICAL